jgi:hypothetical protein
MNSIYTIYLRRSLVMLTFVLSHVFSFCQAISTTVDKRDILIGEQITYNLNIDLPSADYKIDIAIPDSLEHFDIIEKTGGNVNNTNGKYAWQQKIVFTSFDSGSFAFPSFPFRINHLNTISQNLSTDSILINVGYMPIDKEGNPRDIKTILEVEYFNWLWVIIGATILAFLVFLFFLIRYLRKNKKQLPALHNQNAFKEAMQALEQLRKANEGGSVPVKEYHTKLADVLKVYYSKASRQNVLNKTTEEILNKLKSHQLNAETAIHTSEALQTGDATKFAKYHPTFTENELALNYLKNTIEEIEKLRHTKN